MNPPFRSVVLALGLIGAGGGCGGGSGATKAPSTDAPTNATSSTTPTSPSSTTDTSGTTAPDPWACDPTASPTATPTRRLSRAQYEAAIWDAVDRIGGTALRSRVATEVDAQLMLLPSDHADEALSRQDQTVSQQHIDGWYLVAEAVADGLLDLDPLPVSGPDEVPAFIDHLGSRLLRRPLTAEEQGFYLDEVYGPAPTHRDGVRDLVLVWLASPSFTSHMEHGTDTAGETTALSPHEAAARLAFHVWGVPPDDELWALADSGDLLDESTWVAQVDRLHSDPRAQGPRERFLTDWLQLDALPDLGASVGTPAFDAFRGSVDPGADLHERVARDTLDLIQWHLAAGHDLDALLTQPAHTVMDPEVAALYGVETLWDGVSEPIDLTTGHGGLLTRPSFHLTGTATTNPIHKGVWVRRRLLCDTLGDPPADLGELPVLDPSHSARMRTEQLTEQEGTVCATCHASINPLGYATEAFDGLGRPRDEEVVYGDDGQVLARWPIDDTVVPLVDNGDRTEATGAADLADLLAASAKPEACISRFWFRHTWGRSETDADACELAPVRDALAEGSLAEAFRQTTLTPAFRQRTFDDIPATEGASR